MCGTGVLLRSNTYSVESLEIKGASSDSCVCSRAGISLAIDESGITQERLAVGDS